MKKSAESIGTDGEELFKRLMKLMGYVVIAENEDGGDIFAVHERPEYHALLGERVAFEVKTRMRLIGKGFGDYVTMFPDEQRLSAFQEGAKRRNMEPHIVYIGSTERGVISVIMHLSTFLDRYRTQNVKYALDINDSLLKQYRKDKDVLFSILTWGDILTE